MKKAFHPAPILVLLLATLCPVADCRAAAAPDRLVLKIGASKAQATLPLLRLVDAGSLGDAVDIKLDIWLSPEQLVAMAQGGEHHLFTLPLTLAARLRGKGIDIRLTNVNTWGGIALVTSNPAIASWASLRGRVMHVPQRSSPPDILTRYFLDRVGLAAGSDVRFVHAAQSELARLLMAGRIENAVLLEPHASLAASDPALRLAFDFEEEWRRIHGPDSRLPTLGFGGMGGFLEANRDLAARFERAYAEALEWVLANPAEAGRLAARTLGLRADMVEKALPRLGLRYVDAPSAMADVQRYFEVLRDFSPSALGDALPDATLYWR